MLAIRFFFLLKNRKNKYQDIPALPVLGGLWGAPGDTFLCNVAWGGESMFESANVELAAKDGDTSELPGLV